jgi:hypothetical protein
MADIKRKRFPWIGVILIVAGGAMLVNRLGIFQIGYSYIVWSLVMIFGVVEVGRGFSSSNSGRIFFGTVLFLYGLYFLLRATDYVELRGHMFIPATFIIVGFAFIMTYLNNVREWAFLIPATILMGLGAAYILSETGYLYPWEVREMVRMYWPVGLILIGLAILFRRRVHIHKQDAVSDSSPTTSTPEVK